MKRIVLTGAESTGKSTLAAALAAHYGEPYSSEFVRYYVEKTQRAPTVDDLEAIAHGQIGLEDAATIKATDLVLHDTNILSSILYADHYFDVTLNWVDTALIERGYTLYLLCMPDIPWVTDEGQREGPQVRDQLHEMFKASLVKLGLPHVKISGSEDERFKTATSAIDRVL